MRNKKEHYTYEITDAQLKKNCNRGTVGKLLGVEELKIVLLARNLALSSDAVPNYVELNASIVLAWTE